MHCIFISFRRILERNSWFFVGNSLARLLLFPKCGAKGVPHYRKGHIVRLFIIAAAIACGAASSASAVTIVNGSFETGGYSTAVFDTLSAGSTRLTGWTIGGGGIDWISTIWQRADGNRSIDLSALTAGSIAQSITTVQGKRYEVSFALAGNPGGTPTAKVVTLSVNNGQSRNFGFNTLGRSPQNMGWTNNVYSFVATGTASTLKFTSGNLNPSGPALDNIRISAVPESSVWAMLVVGFSLVGGTVRRRSQVVSA